MQIRERVQLMHQPFRVDPAQRVLADVELSCVVAQHPASRRKPCAWMLPH